MTNITKNEGVVVSQIPKMKTIRQTAAMGILTEHALRQMAREGRLPSMQVGKKTLINVDKLIDQLNNLGQSDGVEETEVT